MLLTKRRTSDYISEKFDSFLRTWEIEKERVTAVVTDGGANMKKAVKQTFGAGKHMECFPHKLNLCINNVIHKKEKDSNLEGEEAIEGEDNFAGDIIEDPNVTEVKNNIKKLIDKAKTIVTFFKQSTSASDALHEAQFDENSGYRLIQEVCTRWNSTYAMLNRFVMLVDKISSVLLRIRKAPEMLTRGELAQVQDLIGILRPASVLTTDFSAAKYVTSSRVIPAIVDLREDIGGYECHTELGKKMKRFLIQELDKQFAHCDDKPLLSIPTLLDPRFKRVYFSPLSCSRTLRLINTHEFDRHDEQRLQQPDPEVICQADTNEFWRRHRDRVERHIQCLPEEPSLGKLHGDLQQYIHKKPEVNCDPMAYWVGQKGNAPRLAEIAIKYLSTVASSVPCERLFSSASNIVTAKRNRLSPTHVRMTIFLKSLEFEDWALSDI